MARQDCIQNTGGKKIAHLAKSAKVEGHANKIKTTKEQEAKIKEPNKNGVRGKSEKIRTSTIYPLWFFLACVELALCVKFRENSSSRSLRSQCGVRSFVISIPNFSACFIRSCFTASFIYLYLLLVALPLFSVK